MAAVLQFLGGNVTWIAFAGNMKNLERFAMNPFSNPIFVHFYVADTFCGEIVGPVHARLVIIVNFCGYCGIRKWLTRL